MDRTITLACLSLVLAAVPANAQEAARGPHLTPDEQAAIDAATARGAKWLLAHQDDSGAFRPAVRDDPCPVALSAMALWALASLGRDAAPLESLNDTAEYLLAFRQLEGGLYDPARGLAIYTSGVAARALSELYPAPSDELAASLRDLDLFVYRHAEPESLVDDTATTGRRSISAGSAARELLAVGQPGNHRAALEFLAKTGSGTPRVPVRLRNPKWTRAGHELGLPSYEDVLPIVYRPLAPTDQLGLRFRKALVAEYTLERNPDLTKRFGPDGFVPGTQGLYYYYLLIARTLSVHRSPYLATADGELHDWVRELSRRLLWLQTESGAWTSTNATWWENEPVLVTAYALLALSICRDVESFPKPR